MTVLCGRNNSGKSHIVRQVFASIEEHNGNLARPLERQDPIGPRTPDSRGVTVTLDRPSDPCLSMYSFSTYHQVINKTRVPFDNELEKKNYVDRPILRACLMTACRALPGFESLHHGDELPAAVDRIALARASFKNGTIYRVPVEGTLLDEFEQLAGGTLYVRSEVEKPQCSSLFALRYSDRLHIDYSNWSLGQQVLFCYLALLEFERPAILLMDEPDHALHPSFMTELLSAAKRTCSQVIAATHHPHLIFSRYADDVWFLENLTKPARVPPQHEAYRGHYGKRGTPRLDLELQKVTSDIEKVAQAYRLFDSWDDRLLRLSDLAGIRLAQSLAGEMSSLLALEVKPASPHSRPDLQTLNIRELADVAERSTILDFGAGRGRIWREWHKLEATPKGSWILWEPDTTLRSEMRMAVSELDTSVTIPDSLDEFQRVCDCIVIANVLHECTPPQIAKILESCSRLASPVGRLIIAELHPLLDAERFAVAYTKEDMVDLLNSAGWDCFPKSLNIRSGAVSAYFCTATLREQVDQACVVESIEKLWRRIEKRNCSTYKGRLKFSAADSLTGCLSELTEVAAINSYFNSVWK